MMMIVPILRAMWQYRNEDGTLSDVFDSEQEAIDAYHLHVKRKEFQIRSCETGTEFFMAT